MGRGKGHEILLALMLSNKVPPSKMVAMLRSRSLEAVSGMARERLISELGVSEEDVAAIVEAEGEAASLLGALGRGGVEIVVLGEPEYPVLLKEIASPPPVLFVRGSLVRHDKRALAIVGSRRPSLGGINMAKGLARDLAALGFTVVSGLARGIDTAAHQGALEAGGRTIAVLGSGIDVVYPPENKELARTVASQGALITELLPGSMPLKPNFPRRNRVISGLALGTIVVEAGEKSGALITASFALEQNRTVFAVPGSPGYARSKGANSLIKEGATLVESVEDVLEDIYPQIERTEHQISIPMTAANLSPGEEQVITLLSDVPVHVDEVSRNLRMGAHTVLGLLLSLETRGFVRSLPGKFYVRDGVC